MLDSGIERGLLWIMTESIKAFDIVATNALGIADRMLVWAPSREAAVTKFITENRGWKVQTAREATEILATARIV
jgi:hypothetical protein